ncbi:MAG: hypothetical protein GY798_32830 [Hyphomicrobiales bacterium]|nr:hypothetical protein [Hyphomicrobiales bacterium]
MVTGIRAGRQATPHLAMPFAGCLHDDHVEVEALKPALEVAVSIAIVGQGSPFIALAAYG